MARKFRKSYPSPAALCVEKGVRKPGPGRPNAEQRKLVTEARSKGVTFDNEQTFAAPTE